MPDDAKFVPLAFALAISLGALPVDALSDTNTASFFSPGRLAGAADLRAPDLTDRSDRPVAAQPLRSTQWFNWFNCPRGSGRRC
jgi:hypothetical protein